MRDIKSRKRNEKTGKGQELRQKVLDFVAGNQKKVMILAGTLGAIITFSLGMLTVHLMNRATISTNIEQQQVAEVETTGEIIRITSADGLAIATEDAELNSDEVPGTDAGTEENVNQSSADSVKEKESKKGADKTSAGTSRSASNTTNQKSLAQGNTAASQQQKGSGDTASTTSSSGNAAYPGGLYPPNAKLDVKTDETGAKTEETYLILNNNSETTASKDVIGEAPTGKKDETEAETTKAAPETSASSEEKVSSDEKVSSGEKNSTVELPQDKKKLTVMVYMIGSSLESKSNLAANSIVTMLTGNINTDNVNVIIETGGTKKFHNISTADQKFDESKIQRWFVDGTKLRFLGDAGDTEGNSMTGKETFESFLKYAKKNFPAERYEAVLWGQAGGPVNGFGYDEINFSSGQLAVTNISDALADAEMDLDLLLFDARLMGAMESGYTLASHVDYMIASEDNEYSIGLNYTNWFNGISHDPSMSAIDQGRIILDDFIKDNKGKGDGMTDVVGAYSVIDLKALKRNTSDKLKNLAELLKAAEKTEDGRDHLRQAGKEAYEFAEAYSYDLVDICSFLSAIEENYKGEGKDGIDYGEIRAAARSLKESVQKAVEVNRYVTPEDDGGVSGLTIYFPQQDTDSEKKKNMVSKYENLSFSTSYQQLVKQYTH